MFEPAEQACLINALLYNPGITNEAYIRYRIQLVKADTKLSKGDRHAQIERWCDVLRMYEEEGDWNE